MKTSILPQRTRDKMSELITSCSYPRPAHLCRTCWNELSGPCHWLVKALRAVKERGETTASTYSVSYLDLRASEESGCRWCTLILTHIRPKPDEKFILRDYSSVVITVRITGPDPYHHAQNIQQLNLSVHVDSRKRDTQVAYDVYTTDGE